VSRQRLSGRISSDLPQISPISPVGVEAEAYATAMAGSLEGGVELSLARSFSEGRGGGFFFFSADGRYLAKSMTRAEHHALLQLLPQYCRHMQSQPRSLLSRLSGCYSITMYGQTKFFHVRPGPRLSRALALAETSPALLLRQRRTGAPSASPRAQVLSNVFADLPPMHERFDLKGSRVVSPQISPYLPHISRRFDLKGSWVDRHATPGERGRAREQGEREGESERERERERERDASGEGEARGGGGGGGLGAVGP